MKSYLQCTAMYPMISSVRVAKRIRHRFPKITGSNPVANRTGPESKRTESDELRKSVKHRRCDAYPMMGSVWSVDYEFVGGVCRWRGVVDLEKRKI